MKMHEIDAVESSALEIIEKQNKTNKIIAKQ